MEDVFSADGLPLLDPTPDEEAWEAFLDFAFDRIDGRDANGVTNPQIRRLEKAIGTMLPFEVGLFIVMGVPDGEAWFRWSDTPEDDLARWQSRTYAAFVDDVVSGQRAWPSVAGAEPATDKDRSDVLHQALDAAPQLLPLYGDLAIPVTIADDETSSDANPIFSISGAQVRLVAPDLAAWLHLEFEVPLPMWPETPARRFAFWSDLADTDE